MLRRWWLGICRWVYWTYAARGDPRTLPAANLDMDLRGQEVAVVLEGKIVYPGTDHQEAKRRRQAYRERGLAADLWTNRH